MARKLKRIISGGQSGGDMGGLLAGRELGLETGGTAPPGWMTEFGPKKELLSNFGLVEGEPDPATYPKRTMKNVDSADLTIAFRFKDSTGTDKTIGYAQTGKWQRGELKPGLHMGKRGKPILVITEQNLENAARLISDAVQKLNPETVNIAGHREKSWPGVEKFVQGTLVRGLGSGTGAPKVISSPPSSPQPTEIVYPTSRELLDTLSSLGRKTSSKQIKSTIESLVKQGKVRAEVAPMLGVAVVSAQDRIQGIEPGTAMRFAPKALDERFFEGTKEQLKGERAKMRGAARTAYAESIPPQLSSVIRDAFATAEGKKYILGALRSRIRRGKSPDTPNLKSLVRLVQKEVKAGGGELRRLVKPEPDALGLADPTERLRNIAESRRMSTAPRGKAAESHMVLSGKNLVPVSRYEGVGSGKPNQFADLEEKYDAEFISRPVSSWTSDEKFLSRRLIEQMKSAQTKGGPFSKANKRKFQALVEEFQRKMPDIDISRIEKLALSKVVPAYGEYLSMHRAKIAAERATPPTMAAPGTNMVLGPAAGVRRPLLPGMAIGRRASGLPTRRDEPAMGPRAREMAFKLLNARFGGQGALPTSRLPRIPLKRVRLR